jgi:beta-glucanase (GH16 family)
MVPPLSGAPPEGYQLVFNDEFDRPQLDTAKWNTTMAFAGRQGARYHNPSYLHYVMDDDVLFASGILRLRADRRGIEGDDPPGKFDFTAGLISSHDKFAFKYGYIEVRAKYPRGPGVWPAFWLIGQGEYWPPEFDIAEYYGGAGIMHYGLCHGTLKNVEWDSTGDREPHAEEGWHTYALDWRPGRAVWLQDGVEKKVVDAEYVPDIPMYIILSNGVGSRFGPSGVPDETTVFPNYMEIDYVRVFQPTSVAGALVAEQKPEKKEEKKSGIPLIPAIIANAPAP